MRSVIEGGLTILCEMDPVAQRAAERVASHAPEQLQSRYSWIAQQAARDPLQVAILSLDPRNDEAVKMVGEALFASGQKAEAAAGRDRDGSSPMPPPRGRERAFRRSGLATGP